MLKRAGTLAFTLAMLSPATTQASESTAAWNVVFVLADDLGWSDLACYGSDLHETPHIDRFAGSAMRFTNAYAASPVCTPTRASILTARHPARLNMTIWREAATERGNRKLLEPITQGNLPHEESTLAEVLHEAGYYTAHIGKWHLGTAEYYPQAHGFDANFGGTLWGAPQSFFYPFRGDQYFRGWRYVPDLEPGSQGDYLTDRLTDRALEVIDSVGDRPFFLNLWFHSVHTPIEGKSHLVEKYRSRIRPGGIHINPDYAAMVESLDENVGRVLAKLDEKGLAERTIVVVFSDNGGFINECKLHPGVPVTSNAPLRSGKGSLYEGGIRVPLLVRWPGVTDRSATCDMPVYSCDLLPTLLKMVNLTEQVSLVEPLDGIDVSHLMTDSKSALPQRELFFHYPHYYPTTSPVSAIRSGKWKLLEYFEDDHVELYDLENDQGEGLDLSSRMPDVAGRLRERLHAWREAVGAKLPELNGIPAS